MITAHIIIRSEAQGRLISEWLLKEKLAFESVDLDRQESFALKDGVLVKTETWKLQARTRAMLFERIEQGLRQFADGGEPFLYCTPIVQMDPVMAMRLREETLRV